ncbi:hypothetical protein [Nocardioides donggukensis]|uniref:Uncharacterized protein n=1 Tax=Nocardioides donggukensis TaxID=2774019 RepID=A0A927Q0A5_9ACTN|nr:hypothetical protein [Nocardioides donggukensis]MBD8868214.1 hypothetical protein [Nocardioides donggukensis]
MYFTTIEAVRAEMDYRNEQSHRGRTAPRRRARETRSRKPRRADLGDT